MSEKEYKTGTFYMGRCKVFVDQQKGEWHLSVSCKTNSPSFKDVEKARYKYIPDNVYMALIFPPKEEMSKFGPFTHRLFEIGKAPLTKEPDNAKTEEA